jgi:hypothetical protein
MWCKRGVENFMTLYFKCPECGCVTSTKNLQCPNCRHIDEWKVWDTEYLQCDNCERTYFKNLYCPQCGEMILPKKHEVYRGQAHSSNTSSTSGCFITEATCRSMGRTDDCYELQSFREFRDNWLKKQSDGKQLIEEYYFVAPQIVSVINSKKNSDEIYQDIWNTYLLPCLYDIESKNYKSCKDRYIYMVETLKYSYLQIKCF